MPGLRHGNCRCVGPAGQHCSRSTRRDGATAHPRSIISKYGVRLQNITGLSDCGGGDAGGQSSFVDQRARQDRLSATRAGRDPEERRRAAIPQSTEPFVIQEPLARALDPRRVEILATFPIGRQIAKEVSLVLVVVQPLYLGPGVYQDLADFIEDVLRFLHRLQLAVPGFPGLFVLEKRDVAAVRFVQDINLYRFSSPTKGTD